MNKTKKLIKNAVVGAIVPGSVAYNCTNYLIEHQKSIDILIKNRINTKNTIDNKIQKAMNLTYTGFLDLAMYSFYDISLAAATGKDVLGFGSVFIDNPNYISAAIIGLAIAGTRARLNVFYKKRFKEYKKENMNLLNDKRS
jgi:hypothetical protein